MCAVIRRGILGGFSNKIGNIVGTSWKGIAVMKALPLSVANPNTAGQQTTRQKFSDASKLGSRVLANIIKPLWDRFAQQESGFNAWVKANFPYFPLTVAADYVNITMSQGKMTSTDIATKIVHATSDVATITWLTALTDQYMLSSDLAYIAVYNFDMDRFFFNTGTVLRSAGTANISVPGTTIGDELVIWLSFKRADGSVVNISNVTTITAVS